MKPLLVSIYIPLRQQQWQQSYQQILHGTIPVMNVFRQINPGIFPRINPGLKPTTNHIKTHTTTSNHMQPYTTPGYHMQPPSNHQEKPRVDNRKTLWKDRSHPIHQKWQKHALSGTVLIYQNVRTRPLPPPLDSKCLRKERTQDCLRQ